MWEIRITHLIIATMARFVKKEEEEEESVKKNSSFVDVNNPTILFHVFIYLPPFRS